jgi:hypothetical protein
MFDAKHDPSDAHRLAAHRTVLNGAGVRDLDRRPWQQGSQPASDMDAVRLAAWRATSPEVAPEVVVAGLALLDSARAELDQIEAALLFAARAEGLTFQDIASAIGVTSQQAAQQRMARVQARVERS